MFDLIRTNSFDHDGRLITVTAPIPATGVSAPVTSYSWDSLSRLSSVTDPLGNVTTDGYDSAGELTSVTSLVPATGVAAPIATYAFDGLGREITVGEGKGGRRKRGQVQYRSAPSQYLPGNAPPPYLGFDYIPPLQS